MTVVCAYHELGVGTWIGSDTVAHRDGVVYFGVSKWVVHGDRAIGISGSHVVQNIIEDRAEHIFSGTNYFRVAQRLRSVMIEFGAHPEKSDDGNIPNISVWGIYATSAGACILSTDGGVLEIPSRVMCADGCGDKFALGASHALYGANLGGEDLVRCSVQAAISCSTGCGGEPWVYLLKE